MRNVERKLAVVTGASGGIGLELAHLCAQNNYDLVIAAGDIAVLGAAQRLASSGVTVSPVQCDLSTPEGVDALRNAISSSGKPADILIANAARNMVNRDVPQVLGDAHAYIDGAIYLIDQVSRSMRRRGRGRILINLQAVTVGNSTFLDYFSVALGRGLKRSGVTVTSLIPPAGGAGELDHSGRTGDSAIMSAALKLVQALKPPLPCFVA